MQVPQMKLAPMAGNVSRLTPEAAWAAAWIEAQSLVKQLQAAIARGDIALRSKLQQPAASASLAPTGWTPALPDLKHDMQGSRLAIKLAPS